MEIEELVLAYELHEDGCSWKRIATGLGYDPIYIKNAVRQAKVRGIQSRLTGFGVDRAPRRYRKQVLEAAVLHRAVGMSWPEIALELTGHGDRPTAKSMREAVTNAVNAGHLGGEPKKSANDEVWETTPSSTWTPGGVRKRN